MADRTYIALIEADADGLSVSFPDLPGCVSGGDNLDHAVAMAKEALSLHLDGMVEDGQALPDARSLSEIAQQEDLPARFVYAAITVPEPEASERVNVYMPKSLLAQIERFGERSGIDNRSTFFRLAARQYLSTNDAFSLAQPPTEAEVAAFVVKTGEGGSLRDIHRRMAATHQMKSAAPSGDE